MVTSSVTVYRTSYFDAACNIFAAWRISQRHTNICQFHPKMSLNSHSLVVSSTGRHGIIGIR